MTGEQDQGTELKTMNNFRTKKSLENPFTVKKTRKAIKVKFSSQHKNFINELG